MARPQIDLDMSPREEAVAIALFEQESIIHDFRIAWSDIGGHRRYGYKLKAKAVLHAADNFKETGNARGPEDTSAEPPAGS